MKNREIRDVLNSMPEDQLDNEFIIHGEEEFTKVAYAEPIPDDYINPDNEWDSAEPRSLHVKGGDCYEPDSEFNAETEPAVIKKGTIIFYQDL